MNVLASKGQLRASFFRWALFTVPACLLLGFLSGVFGGSPDSLWFESLIKPDIFPEPKWFGIVWSVLYVMMGIALALVCAAWGARGRTAALAAFAVQFVLNLAWSPVFFGLHQITAALVVIGLLAAVVIVTIALFWRVRKLAAILLLPYLAWVCFATLLNYEFLQLNPESDGAEPTGAIQRIEI
ncbi:tryptophan-rich sensory protein [Pontixanthobacter gangjinensis]|uniref:Tryptophan-rich sensory protein n=1 Tax=Pontixanthobacter gangjinensis TaxID=1028742 RepID=A0A6I4SLK5_9SPHN|nr:TspO/MBR family protein [Pontixanthobacter gangjinensis]MXO56605.1 tryptophan-rich sensory protein [Pontixanthobacter gangjinensis]